MVKLTCHNAPTTVSLRLWKSVPLSLTRWQHVFEGRRDLCASGPTRFLTALFVFIPLSDLSDSRTAQISLALAVCSSSTYNRTAHIHIHTRTHAHIHVIVFCCSLIKHFQNVFDLSVATPVRNTQPLSVCILLVFSLLCNHRSRLFHSFFRRPRSQSLD